MTRPTERIDPVALATVVSDVNFDSDEPFPGANEGQDFYLWCVAKAAELPYEEVDRLFKERDPIIEQARLTTKFMAFYQMYGGEAARPRSGTCG